LRLLGFELWDFMLARQALYHFEPSLQSQNSFNASLGLLLVLQIEMSKAGGSTPETSAFGRLRQEDHEFQASLG
jgi:hypothetical protein